MSIFFAMEELYLLHGSRTPAAVALSSMLARSGKQIFVSWDGREPGGAGFFQPARPTLRPPRATSRMKQVLCTVRQDNEDIADEYILDTVLQACPKQDGKNMALVVILHFCSESGCRGPVVGEGDVLESMEEGVLQTRRSLRLVRSARDLASSGGALVFLLPGQESDSRSLYEAAHKTSRIVDQNPLKHVEGSGSPCTFGLSLQCDEPELSAKLVLSWLQELVRTPPESWALLGVGSVVSLQPSEPPEDETAEGRQKKPHGPGCFRDRKSVV